jgi:hypothetical protein
MKLATSLTILFSVSMLNPVLAQDSIQLCRPRVNNVIQTTIQFIAYLDIPRCTKKGQGNLKLTPNTAFSLKNRNIRFRDNSGRLYRHEINMIKHGTEVNRRVLVEDK